MCKYTFVNCTLSFFSLKMWAKKKKKVASGQKNNNNNNNKKSEEENDEEVGKKEKRKETKQNQLLSKQRVYLLTCTDNPGILSVNTVMDSPTIEVARGQGELTPSTVYIVHPDLACPLTKSCPGGSTCCFSVAQLTTDNLREARVGSCEPVT